MLKDSSEVLYFVFVRFLNQLGFNKLYYYSLIFFKSEFHFAKKIYPPTNIVQCKEKF